MAPARARPVLVAAAPGWRLEISEVPAAAAAAAGIHAPGDGTLAGTAVVGVKAVSLRFIAEPAAPDPARDAAARADMDGILRSLRPALLRQS